MSNDEKPVDNLTEQPPLPVGPDQHIYTVYAVGIDIHGLPGIVVDRESSAACYRLPSELTGWVAGVLDYDAAGFN